MHASLRVPQATRIVSSLFVSPTEMVCISPETKNGPGVLGSSLSKWRRCITQQCLLYVIANSCHFDNDSGERIHTGVIQSSFVWQGVFQWRFTGLSFWKHVSAGRVGFGYGGNLQANIIQSSCWIYHGFLEFTLWMLTGVSFCSYTFLMHPM